MSARDSLETDTRVVDDPDATRETAPAENAMESPRGEVLDDPEIRREASAESRQRVDGDWESRPFVAPRDELGRFDLKRAGLPDMSIDSAAKYIDEHRDSRPWLAMADCASPEARRIIAAMDAAGGHAHIRHEGWVSEEANRRRVACREDPAQLDPEKRGRSVDGLRENDQRHRCGELATRITDPDAFATAFTRGVQHPKVREAMAMPFDPDKTPAAVIIPIAELLGSKGHENCTGWQLAPVEGSVKTAREQRSTWVTDRSEGREPGGPEPRAVPVPTFEGGAIIFAFTRIEAEQRYGVVTMFVQPPKPQVIDSDSTIDPKEQHDGIVLLGT
jgi:hypothetical protein